MNAERLAKTEAKRKIQDSAVKRKFKAAFQTISEERENTEKPAETSFELELPFLGFETTFTLENPSQDSRKPCAFVQNNNKHKIDDLLTK